MKAMTMTMPDNSSAKRITVQIPTASGDAIEAWVYRPEGGGTHPAVVMAHGIGGIKAGGLAPFAERFRDEGFVAMIRDRPTSPRSPWQNAYAERLIGSIRRECVDHIVVFGERHLRHALLSYLNYYNEVRTHLSLGKDAPVSRVVHAVGRILPRPILGGLHHQYVRL